MKYCIEKFCETKKYYVEEDGKMYKEVKGNMKIENTRINKINNRMYLFKKGKGIEVSKIVYYYFVERDEDIENYMIDYKDGNIENLRYDNLIKYKYEEYLEKKYGNRWKEIEYDNLKGYYICTDGKVWSKYIYDIINTYFNNKSGFISLKIKIKQKMYVKHLHLIVANTFIPNEYGYKYVRHISTDLTDNSINNLRWDNSKISYNYERKKNYSNSKSEENDGGIYIEGYEEKYIIYENGDVYNTNSKKLLKHIITNIGFESVSLRKDGSNKMFLVHRLVAKYFIPKKKYELDEVIHKDGNVYNNHKDNLEWMKDTKQINKINRNKYIKKHYGKKIVQINKNNGKIVNKYECLSKTGLSENKQYLVAKVLNGDSEYMHAYIWKYE